MNKQILVILSSIKGEDSVSNSLAKQWLEHWQQHYPADEIVVRDLAVNPLPYLDNAALQAMMQADVKAFPDEIRPVAKRLEATVGEFMSADLVLVAAPMYNFGIPATLKTWLDHITLAGKTFRYTEQGPQGLCAGKQVVILSTRGSFYDDDALDFQEGQLTTLFGFLGIRDIEVIRAQGLDTGADARIQSLRDAQAALPQAVKRDNRHAVA